MAQPTYGDIINMLKDVEIEAQSSEMSAVDILTAKFRHEYPHIVINRPSRFLDSIRRIAAPTRPSAVGPSKLSGSPLRTYLKRTWVPRTRNPVQGTLQFPSELQDYGLTENVLREAFLESCHWSLKEIPTVGFYRKLHNFLRKWPPSRSATKTAVGKFYISIDPELHKRDISGRPDNIFRFIQSIVLSDKLDSAPMTYGMHVTVNYLQSKVAGCSAEIKGLSSTVNKQEQELNAMKEEVAIARAELLHTKSALANVTNKLQTVKKQRDCARKQVRKWCQKLETTIADSVHYEEELLVKNEELSELICTLQKEISSLSCSVLSILSDVDSDNQSLNFCFQTKEGGRVYTPAIRNLYYTLLANQLPPAKIVATIKTILKCFFPSLNVESLQLPKRSCASYMRKHELTTVNLAHKATAILEQAESGLHLNIDGTTKSQKKLEGAAVNGMVLSVNEVPDGTAESMIEDISKELRKLREIAYALHLPNADRLNWTLIVSATSDSASAQKRFNKLLQEQREKDEETFGPTCPEAIELVENFCGMHLGVNLRKAFLEGIKSVTSVDSVQQHEYHQADVLVHEFCKLFGKTGVPEYGLGTLGFPDFLEEHSNSASEKTSYYQLCSKVRLDRQVGSRYFVSAANAGKILFLQEAAVDYLQYSDKNCGNKLEQTVFKKLQDPDELSQLKCDAIMFHQVYSNLVMLVKSTQLNKCALDMNKHYLELKVFLEEVELNPHIALDKDYKVFVSEDLIYGSNKKLNHCLHFMYKPIEERIFREDEWDHTLLYPLLSAGASAMKEKLCTYAHTQLPGGEYWEPKDAVKEILKKLKPNNDLCESILGLNDYLTTAIPNLHQMSRSNLIHVKKNKTMQWFHQLPHDKRDYIIKLAIKRRAEVEKLYKAEEVERSRKRRDKMVQEKHRRDALKQRADAERERLAKLPLITSVDELDGLIGEIDDEVGITSKKKTQKKLAIIREQVNIRKKVLKQKINVPFTHKGKQRPLQTIIKEISDFIANENVLLSTNSKLVGKRILHKFEVDKKEKWFTGYVVSYDAHTQLYELEYDEEEEKFFFNLEEDISQGDIIIIENNN